MNRDIEELFLFRYWTRNYINRWGNSEIWLLIQYVKESRKKERHNAPSLDIDGERVKTWRSVVAENFHMHFYLCKNISIKIFWMHIYCVWCGWLMFEQMRIQLSCVSIVLLLHIQMMVQQNYIMAQLQNLSPTWKLQLMIYFITREVALVFYCLTVQNMILRLDSL